MEAEAAPHALASELSVELNVTSAEQSGSESATEDNATDKEEEIKQHREDLKVEKEPTPGNLSPLCKRLSPKPGMYLLYIGTLNKGSCWSHSRVDKCSNIQCGCTSGRPEFESWLEVLSWSNSPLSSPRISCLSSYCLSTPPNVF